MCSFIDSLYCEKLREYIKKPSAIEINEDEFAVRIDNQSSFVIKKTISFDQESYSIFYTERGTERLLDSSLELKRIKKSFAIKLKTAFSERPNYESRKRFEMIESENEMIDFIDNSFDVRYFSIGHKESNKLCLLKSEDNKYDLYLVIIGCQEKILVEKAEMIDAYFALYNYLVFYTYYSDMIIKYELLFNEHTPSAEEILDYLDFPVM